MKQIENYHFISTSIGKYQPKNTELTSYICFIYTPGTDRAQLCLIQRKTWTWLLYTLVHLKKQKSPKTGPVLFLKTPNLRNTANYTPHFFPTDSSDLSRRQFGSSLKPLLFLIWFWAYKMETTRTKRWCWAEPHHPWLLSAWKYNSVLTWNIQLSSSYFIKTKARQCEATNYRCTIKYRYSFVLNMTFDI